MIIYQSNDREYKGNLHLHTTLSDGRKTPLEAALLYEQAGYDFLAFTDHRSLTLLPEYRGRMVLLNGIELDEEPNRSELIHLLGIGMGEELMTRLVPGISSQKAIDLIRECCGVCFLAHPHWSMNRPETIKALKGLSGVEIFNSVSRPPYNADRADSTQILDLLATDGLLFPTLANDDTHFYEGELFGGFILAQAESLSAAHILDALKNGRFYATQGPRFQSVLLEGDLVRVTCSPVSHIMYNSNLAWNTGRCTSGKQITHGEYRLDHAHGERFVRVVLEDEKGLRAWLNPFSVQGRG